MAQGPKNDDVEIVCPRCDYHMQRTADRLRRETEILCPNCGAVILPAADEREDGAQE